MRWIRGRREMKGQDVGEWMESVTSQGRICFAKADVDGHEYLILC